MTLCIFNLSKSNENDLQDYFFDVWQYQAIETKNRSRIKLSIDLDDFLSNLRPQTFVLKCGEKRHISARNLFPINLLPLALYNVYILTNKG